MPLIAPTSDLIDELESVNESFERSTPLKILEWTFERFNDDVAMACSFEDVALLHMVHQLRPHTEIIFLDTLGHFPETLEFASRLEREWSLNMTRTTPDADADAWPCGTERCCQLRKVEPLGRAVAGRSAWITSVKRVDAPTRTSPGEGNIANRKSSGSRPVRSGYRSDPTRQRITSPEPLIPRALAVVLK